MKAMAKLAAIYFTGLLLAACSGESDVPAAPSGPPTTVFVNGDIITVNPAQPSAEAVAVRSGTILAVGTRQAVEAAAGNNIEVRDLQGHTLLPGFIDAHGHFSGTGQIQMTANIASPPVGPVQDIAGLIEALEGEADPDDDARRQYYRLTPLGRDVLRAEAGRLEALVLAARTSAELKEA